MRIASEQLSTCRARLDEVKSSLDKARGASQEWKAKPDDAERRVAAAMAEVAQHAKQIERVQAQAARTAEQQARELDQLRARVADLTEKRARDVADLRGHLATSPRRGEEANQHVP